MLGSPRNHQPRRGHTVFRRAEGLGAGLRTEGHGLGVELDRDCRPTSRDWNGEKAVAALTGAARSTGVVCGGGSAILYES
jgi:hypothetical protein